jgi:hypothetical protein
MRGIRRGGTAAAPGSAGDSRRRWRTPAVAATALAAISLSVPLGTGLATAASAAPAPRPKATSASHHKAKPAPHPKAPAVRPDFAPSGAVVAAGSYIFFNWGDGTVYRKVMTETGVRPPGVTTVGGHVVGGPAAMTLGSTRTALVFGQGTDGALWMTSCAAKRCTGKWTSLGGQITSKPAIADVNGSAYSVYGRGADGAVWARDHTAMGWGPWHTMGGKLLAGTSPSAAYRAGIHEGTFVLAVGADRVLYMAHAGVAGFERAGGETTATPALVNTPAALVGFVRGMDGAGYYHRFMPSSPGWHLIEASTLSSGISASASGNSTVVYAMGGNGQVYADSGSWARYPPTFSGWGQRTP